MASSPDSTPPPLPWGRRQASPRLLALAALAVGAGGLFLLAFHNPATSPGGLLPCVWHVATGTHCPGCGITRALHALVHGRVMEALDYNAFGLLVLIATSLVLVRPARTALRENRWVPPALPRHTAMWLLATGLLWALLRNLPGAPFALLAP